MPIQGKMGQKIGKTKRKMMQAADNRVKFINEILQGIRVVKLYAWELPLLREVAKLRGEELKRLLLKTKYFAVLSGFNYVSPQLVALLTLGTYSLIGKSLTVSKTFTVIALINVMRFSIRILPWGAMLIIEGRVSSDRITKFLKLPNLKVPPIGTDDSTPVMMENCSFTWVPIEMAEEAEKEKEQKETLETTGKDEEAKGTTDAALEKIKSNSVVTTCVAEENDKNDENETEGKTDGMPTAITNKSVIPMTPSAGPTLHSITFSLKRGSLTAVVGLVGSGKSSLLSSILGELDRLEGNVEVNGRISYTAQTPFIINATVRDNILFGMPYDRDKYKRCIKAACLLHDLRLLGKKDCMFFVFVGF